MPRTCGACNACCKLLRIPDLDKPAGMLCEWTTIHGGCSRQAEKPKDPFNPVPGEAYELAACAQFKCVWLQSQTRTDPGEIQPRHWRPDISHVMMGPKDRDNELHLFVHVDPNYPNAWTEPEINAYLRGMVERGCEVEIVIGETTFMLEAV